MSSDSGETVPYAPVLPGTLDHPPRTQPPVAIRPVGPQPRRTRFLDPFAIATNHPVRRPAPVAAAHLAPAAQAPLASALSFPPFSLVFPPEHPYFRPRRVRGAANPPELLRSRREYRASQRRVKELVAEMTAAEALRDAEL